VFNFNIFVTPQPDHAKLNASACSIGEVPFGFYDFASRVESDSLFNVYHQTHKELVLNNYKPLFLSNIEAYHHTLGPTHFFIKLREPPEVTHGVLATWPL